MFYCSFFPRPHTQTVASLFFVVFPPFFLIPEEEEEARKFFGTLFFPSSSVGSRIALEMLPLPAGQKRFHLCWAGSQEDLLSYEYVKASFLCLFRAFGIEEV